MAAPTSLPSADQSPPEGAIGPHPLAHVRDAAGRVEDQYAHGEDRPLGSYLGALSVYAGLVAAAVLIGRKRQIPLPERISGGDLALIAVATHKLSRTIAKDAVTSPLRAPFTSYTAPAGAGEINEEVRARGWSHGIGELISCPFCLAQWVSTAFVGGLVVAPRATRLVASVFAARAGSDMLQFGYAALERAAE